MCTTCRVARILKGMAAKATAKKPASPVRRAVRTALIVLAFVTGLVVLVIVAAFTFTPLQPLFVNKDLRAQHKLHIPEVLQPRIENGEKIFDLTVQQGETNIVDGKKTKTLGYNGAFLGPTLRARKGDTVRIHVTNKLSDATTTHWHGMHLPAAMDGAAHQLIKPGENWQPQWTVTNQAASLWYHPHLMGKTGEQVYRGLGGMFIIDDERSDALALPKEYGVDDIPLIVQDKKFDANGQLVYRPHNQDVLGHTGMLGDSILVNGTYAPYAEVPAKQVRLRVLNGSNARRYNFGFEDGRTFYQIATDGGFLEKPIARTTLVLGSAERAEIVVDLTATTKPLTLMSYAVHEDNQVLRFARTLLGAQRDENQQFSIIELRPQPTAATATPLPQNLATIKPPETTSSTRTRTFVLDPGSQTINGKKMDHRRIDHVAYAGDTEIWEFNNQSGVPHPMHIHGVQFFILTRNGRPAEAHERGWKDTVLVQNGEIVRVAVIMPEYSDLHQPYMIHCHILEHEDMGMMGQFMVVARGTKQEDIFVRSKLTEGQPEEPQHMH